MQTKATCRLLLVGLVIVLSAAAPLGGEVPGRSSGRADPQAASEDDIVQELAALKEAIDRLERKIDRISQRPSEFSRIVVRVADEQGKSLSGFEVELTSSDQAQRAKASGESNEEGVALSRDLPYGSYRMSVSGRGWHARHEVTVEVGQPLELTIVAPTPEKRGELVLEASLPSEPLEGLRFGGWQTKHEQGWATLMAPEPDEGQEEVDEVVSAEVQEEPSNGWKTFPTVSDGIETVAVVVEFTIEGRIEQPDGNRLTWQWRPASGGVQQPHLRWFVQSDGTLRPLLNVAERRKAIERQAGWFGAIASDENEKHNIGPSREKRLGYDYLKLGDEQRGRATLRLPARDVTLAIREIYGLPSQEVLNAIAEPAESSAGQLWLCAGVLGDSKWFRRVLSNSMTVKGLGGGFTDVVDLATNESEKVLIGIAKPSN